MAFFDLNIMKDHRMTLILGKKGSGKSTVLKNILYFKRNTYDTGIGFCGSYGAVQGLAGHIPAGLLYDEGFDEEVFVKFIQQAEEYKAKNRNKNLFVIFDDCMYDKKIMSGKHIRKLYMNGRHMNATHFNCVQYMMDMPIDLRNQVDYVFMMKETSHTNLKKIYDMFFKDAFKKFDEFCTAAKTLTEGHRCIVFDRTYEGNDVSKQIYHFKASQNLEDFKLCRSIYWDLNDACVRVKDPNQPYQALRFIEDSKNDILAHFEASRTSSLENASVNSHLNASGNFNGPATEDDDTKTLYL